MKIVVTAALELTLIAQAEKNKGDGWRPREVLNGDEAATRIQVDIFERHRTQS